jgi:hypothetical protein
LRACTVTTHAFGASIVFGALMCIDSCAEKPEFPIDSGLQWIGTLVALSITENYFRNIPPQEVFPDESFA